MTDVVLRAGQVLGDRYDVIEEIGRGGMATVYRARDRRHERDVAVKVLHPDLCRAIAAERFLLEIRIEARLQHPHILGIHDSGQVDGCPYYVMPFVAGETLKARLEREGQFPLPDALRITRDVASALAHAHTNGVIHRDVKPQNILLSSGQAMLADFGIARAMRDVGGSQLTERGVAIGTPAYMSPEQAAGDTVIDARSDVYSLACVLYEMLAGEPPFSGRTPQAVIARHLLERVPSLEIVRPGISPGVREAIERALAKSPADRFATVQEFIAALDEASGAPRPRRRRVATAAIALTAAAVLALVALRPDPPALDRRRIVVFPLEERGLPPTLAGAGVDVALMINAALEHADPLRPLDVRDRLAAEQRANAALLGADERRNIAISRGAALYVTGVVQAYQDSVSVTLRLHDVAGDSMVIGRTATGSRSSVSLHQLGIDATKRLMPSLIDPGREIDLAVLRDRDASAIALFLQGERAYRQSNFEEALALYERALGADSALALAAVKGAQAASWSQNDARTAALVRLAVARGALLPPRYALYARGLEAYLAGNADSATAWLERALGLAPNWAEASMVLGEVAYHLVPLRPRPDSVAEAFFAAALASDSGFTPPLFHLAEIAIRDGDLPRARTLVARFTAHTPTPRLAMQLRMMLDCVSAGHSNFDWTEAVRAAPTEVLLAGKALAAGGRQLGCADGAFRSLLTSDGGHPWNAFLGHHAVLAATGEPGRIVALGDSLVAAGTLQQAMMLYIIDALAGIPVGEKTSEVVAFGKGRWGERYEGLRARESLAWLLWMFGVWHAELGDEAIVEALHSALDSAVQANGTPSQQLYAAALGARLALLRADTAEAIRRYRTLSPQVDGDELLWDLGLPMGAERLRLAELLLARGRHREAHDVASTFDHPGPVVYLIYLPRSLVIRHRAAVADGRREAAARYRARLIALGRTDLVEALD